MTIDTALVVAFVGIVCLLLCSPRRDEMLYRWMPQRLQILLYQLTGWHLVSDFWAQTHDDPRWAGETYTTWHIVYRWRRF